MRLRLATFVLAASLCTASGAVARTEPADNCATVLGSIAVELRIARNLPPGRKSSYNCPKAYRSYGSLVGASRARIQRSLGAPDRHAEDGGWSWFFASRYAEVPAGAPELVIHFGGEDQVESIACRHSGA
jgi:hypothetical protein